MEHHLARIKKRLGSLFGFSQPRCTIKYKCFIRYNYSCIISTLAQLACWINYKSEDLLGSNETKSTFKYKYKCVIKYKYSCIITWLGSITNRKTYLAWANQGCTFKYKYKYKSWNTIRNASWNTKTDWLGSITNWKTYLAWANPDGKEAASTRTWHRKEGDCVKQVDFLEVGFLEVGLLHVF